MRLKLFFVVSLFVLFGQQSVFANKVGNKDCQEFTVGNSGDFCYVMVLDPWITFGGGWTSIVRGANIGSQVHGTVQLSWGMGPAIPMTDGWYNHLSAMVTGNRILPVGSMVTTEAGGQILPYGESGQVTFLGPPANCDTHGQNCDYGKVDLNTNVSGTIWVGWLAAYPEYLRGLAMPTLQYYHPSGLQATEFAVPPAPVWRDVISASADGKLGYSFAIANVGKPTTAGTISTTVFGTLTDQNGRSMSTQTWTIPADGTLGIVLTSPKDGQYGPGFAPGFGNEVFTGGPMFTGVITLQVTQPFGGTIVATSLQFTDNGITKAMSSSGIHGSQQ